MKNYVLKVFKGAISGAQCISYNDRKDTVIAAQRITDAILKGVGEQVFSMWVNITDSLLSVALVWILIPWWCWKLMLEKLW